MFKIHTFGDSHADGKHSHWGYIRIPNVNIITHHLGGKLMYSFGRLGLNLLNIKNYNVNENDTVIFCFGEIDCRNHIHKHITTENNYESIIDNLVISYFNAINENVKLFKKINVCVYNVVPPSRGFKVDDSHPYPFLGSDEERKTYTLYMNKKIKELCVINNYYYFDIYDESCDEYGFLNKSLSDGNVHLRDSTYSTCIIKNIINIYFN